MKKEELVNMLIEKNNIDKIEDDYRKHIYQQRLMEFIEELYDQSKDIAYPLNRAETETFRQKYGVFNDGLENSQNTIAEKLNVSRARIYQRLERGHVSIRSHIIDKAKFVEIASSNDAKPIFIEEMKLSTRSYHGLKRAGFSRIEDVSKLTTDELLKIKNLGKTSAEEIIDTVHRHRYCFADEYAVVDGTVVNAKSLNSVPQSISTQDIIMNKQLWVERYLALKAQKEQLMTQVKCIDEEMDKIIHCISEAETYNIKIKSKTK